MNGKFLYISAFITIIIIIGSILLVTTDWNGSSTTPIENDPPENIVIEETSNGITEIIEPEIKYIEYSQDIFSENKINNDNPIILFFYTSDCLTCVATEKDILDNKDSKEMDLTIFKINFDTETELKNKYLVTEAHTFIQIDNELNEIKRWTGGGLEEIISQITE